jgi:hypothetical protein
VRLSPVEAGLFGRCVAPFLENRMEDPPSAVSEGNAADLLQIILLILGNLKGPSLRNQMTK